ncbi:hypothetical protein [Agathobacter rectalis]|uniref:Uncharacterized protein n=1 Tax=Agathobacter rectalis TaxID=39491 RepID=A0A3E4YLG2_9FIRM|nr:hypothetical protein [Agathobacter rectalis]RGM75321.1 hypothetical protein DXB99_01950 [Agathobacter rectalis]
MKIKAQTVKNNQNNMKTIFRAIIIFMLIACMLVPTFATVVYADSLSVTPDTQQEAPTDEELQYEGDIDDEIKINDSQESYNQYKCKINLKLNFCEDADQQNISFLFYNEDTGATYSDMLYYNTIYMSTTYNKDRTYLRSYCLPAGNYQISATCSGTAKYFVYIDNSLLNEDKNDYTLTDGIEIPMLVYTKDDVEAVGNLQQYLDNFNSKWEKVGNNEFNTSEDKKENSKKTLGEDTETIDSDEEDATNSKSLFDTIKNIIILIIAVIFVIFLIIKTIKMKILK